MEIKRDGVYIERAGGCYTVDLEDAELAIKKSVPVNPLCKQVKLLGVQYDVSYCPTCGEDWDLNRFGTDVKYCWHCGQAIRWSNK